MRTMAVVKHPPVSANQQLIAALAAGGWGAAALQPLQLFPLPVRSGAVAHALLAGVTAELAAAIDAALARDGRALARSLEGRSDTELLCEAMVARHRAPRAPAPPAEPPACDQVPPACGGSELTLIVDCAERLGGRSSAQIVAALQARGVRCERRQLAVGDYCWVLARGGGEHGRADDLVLRVIAERKTASDLAASVQDGRYHEQKYRLAKARSLGVCRVGYIFEGALAAKGRAGADHRAAWRAQALPSALAKTAAHSRFSVLHTPSADATAGLLAELHRSLGAALRAEAAAAGPGACLSTLLATDPATGRPLRWSELCARLAKRDEESRTAVWGKMLLQLPGVSAKIAEAVRAAFPTAAAARAALRRAGGREAGAALVAELRLRDSARRVGPVAAARIAAVLAPAAGAGPACR